MSYDKRPTAKVPDGPLPTSKPPIAQSKPSPTKDRGLICRMAGNIAGPVYVKSLESAVRSGSKDPVEVFELSVSIAVRLAEAIVAEYDRRHP